MKSKISIRMGDGELVSMSSLEIKEDILAATEEAAGRADIPEFPENGKFDDQLAWNLKYAPRPVLRLSV